MDEEDGIRTGRVRARRWTRISRGLYAGPGADPLLAWQRLLPPSGAFTHLTAAEHYGLWLPTLPDALPIFATVPSRGSRPRRPGLYVSRHTHPVEVLEESEVRWVNPAEALLACSRNLSLLDRLVLVDSALHLGACTRAELEAKAAEARAGSPALRLTLAWADRRSESPWETLLRILHEVCDVPVEPQHEVFDAQGGFVARGDLWIRGTTSLHEYDGGDHLDRPQQRSDLRRGRRIANTKWVRRGYTSAEVLFQGVGILRDADLAVGRPHDPARIRRWHRLLSESLFTPAGTAAFLRRLGIQHPGDQALSEKRSPTTSESA